MSRLRAIVIDEPKQGDADATVRRCPFARCPAQPRESRTVQSARRRYPTTPSRPRRAD